jgi:hypothetical protein
MGDAVPSLGNSPLDPPSPDWRRAGFSLLVPLILTPVLASSRLRLLHSVSPLRVSWLRAGVPGCLTNLVRKGVMPMKRLRRIVRRVRRFFFRLRNRWTGLWGGWLKPELYHPEDED